MRFIHVRKPNTNKGGMTIGYVLDPLERRAVVSVAKCSSDDNYSKPMGRTICSNRYHHGTGYLVPVDPFNVEESVIENTLKAIERKRA